MHLANVRRLKTAMTSLIGNNDDYDWNTYRENLRQMEDRLVASIELQEIEINENTPDYHELFVEHKITGPNRPKLSIDMEIIQYFRERRFKWKAIADILEVSSRTLKRRREEMEFIDPIRYTELSNEGLKEQISTVLECMPKAGLKTVQGALRGEGTVAAFFESIYQIRHQCTTRSNCTVSAGYSPRRDRASLPSRNGAPQVQRPRTKCPLAYRW